MLVFIQASSAESSQPFTELWLHELEALKQQTEAELNGLAHPSLNSGVGAVGYRSKAYADDGNHYEWVQIDLEGSYIIDTIFIIPTLWRDTRFGFVNDAFPQKFRILIGNAAHPEGKVIFTYNADEAPFTGITPMQIPVDSKPASWVRVETNHLTQRALDGMYIFQLSEIMVFEGNEDRALRKPVSASSPVYESATRNAGTLVDGILPYLINSTEEEHSRAYVSDIDVGDRPALTIDLLETTEITGIRLHATDQADTVPTAHAGEFGLPPHFIVETANNEDFTDAEIVLNVKLNSIFEMGPVLSWNFSKPSHARYIRVTALTPYYHRENHKGSRVSFAEIEVLQQGLNIARNKPISTNYKSETSDSTLSALVDGMNIYGHILPQKQWLEQLSRRHELTILLGKLRIELQRRYTQQKSFLRWAIIAAIFMALVIVFTIPYYKMLSYRKEVHIRERIAANLHDELGANLHAIGMLGDVAERSINVPERLVEAVRRIRALTERTGEAARHCTNMLEAQNICKDIVLEIKQDTQRLLGDHEVSLRLYGEAELEALPRRARIDLYLFFKESLTNINRHAQATKVYIRIAADPQIVKLSVIDNGCGMNAPPKSLLRRARLMRASIQTKPVQPHGTHIRLKIKLKRNRLFL
ncbi:histidine kinase [Coraliomargarita sp. SDUM461004]|uniref:histidine kinase n=1 Tax=Thalassobacterium sedimentorum TaxID=3041258 RepID=A0ABU1APX1_9BACT|nr:histidine kinase [Coraliomargarita sp. SDUM461004]MDQ8195638.1 histidine kinase [Coraliomargarita sp. SDUM461004]